MAKGKSPRHTGARRGTKVQVTLRDGEVFEDIFHERNDSFIFLVKRGKIRKSLISRFVAIKKEYIHARN